MAKNVIPVIHVGGRIGQYDNGVLSYLDGEVYTFDAVDPETLCKSDLEGMAKSLGFPIFSVVYWLEPTAMNLEFGLFELNGDRAMDELRNRILATGCVDFEVFFEHPISEPIVAEEFEEPCAATQVPNSASASHAPLDPVERAKKSKKKKPRMATSAQHEEMDYSQSAPTPPAAASTPEPVMPPSDSPVPPPPARFRAKQPIIRPPTENSATSANSDNPKELGPFTFMPTPGFKLPGDI
ncbi:hypothetical protein PIB30_024774 [Stylosanthes scabra]|uniref:PB1-like domain-containing protein n=1 Tax=Stylosanthes scabra TaxID=79078 RepID=A0ABU6U8U9_9FABA|nr:hypothetical protein [Stylosanthes scabra]